MDRPIRYGLAVVLIICLACLVSGKPAAAQGCDALGSVWVMGEVVDYQSPTGWAWNGRWVRRFGTNTWDAMWTSRSGQKIVVPVTITQDGTHVTVQRPNCVYDGVLVGTGVSGTYNCTGAGINYWNANMACELGEPACGLGTEWRVNDSIQPGVFNPGWVSVWTRQGTGSLFDMRASRAGETDTTASISIAIDGNKVTAQRTDPPNRFTVTDCLYEGFLIGKSGAVTGTVSCNAGVGRLGPFFWDARIICGANPRGAGPEGGGPGGGGGNPPGGGGNPPGGGGACQGDTWRSNARNIDNQFGKRFTFCCPPGGQGADVYGTAVYTSDSSVCTAGVHAGPISFQGGGNVIIEIRPGQEKYEASTHNGVTSYGYGSFPGSYVIVGASPAGGVAAAAPQAALSKQWGGTWGQPLNDGALKSTVSISGNSLNAQSQYQNGDGSGTLTWNGVVSGNTAKGTWTGAYSDPDKSAQRHGTFDVSLSGDKITGQALEDEPVFNWKVSPYASAVHKGAIWPIDWTRTK